MLDFKVVTEVSLRYELFVLGDMEGLEEMLGLTFSFRSKYRERVVPMILPSFVPWCRGYYVLGED